MSVITVQGPVGEGELGIVLAHEHLFMDLRNQFTPFQDAESARISRQKVRMANLGRLRRNPYAVRDNLVLDDPAVMAREARAFKELGGRTIVECTSIGIGRNARALKELADSTGLHVIAGCGYYTQDTHPPQMSGWSAEEVAAQMVRDLTEGMDGTDVRAGVIGEIGTSDPIRPDEWKVLEAAALAHVLPEGVRLLSIHHQHVRQDDDPMARQCVEVRARDDAVGDVRLDERLARADRRLDVRQRA